MKTSDCSSLIVSKSLYIDKADSPSLSLKLSQGKCSLFFETEKSKDRIHSIFLKLKESFLFNRIILKKTQFNLNSANVFISDDGENYSKVYCRIQDAEGQKDQKEIWLPLVQAEFIQLVFRSVAYIKHEAEIFFEMKSSVDIDSSSDLDRLWVSENLIDGRDNYGWAVDISDSKKEHFIKFDLNDIYYISQVKLLSAKNSENSFPFAFTVCTSLDGYQWESIIQEGNFLASEFCWYNWQFIPSAARYLKLNILESSSKQKICKILEADILASAENRIPVFYKNASSNLGYAGELLPGVVKFAAVNEKHPLKALQSSDPRLEKATSEYPGIVQFAQDGLNEGGKALQSNDSRLRRATSSYPGIVQLGKDGDNSAGLSVQADDSRLRYSSEKEPGIIQLARDKEVREGLAIQASDSRLRFSTTEYPGIVQLAKDGISLPNTVVQADDSRLREASSTWPGIMIFSKHNEAVPNKALQSDDPRLLEATEERKGRVQLAKDRESKKGKVIQANDSRLEKATESEHGIVRLAKSGVEESGMAVQANDPRLKDAREPLNHNHDYAAKNHELSSHPGPLNMSVDKKTSEIQKYSIPELKSFPLSVKNKAGLCAAFQGGIAVGSETDVALEVYSKANPGVQAKSKNRPGGVYFSEKDYALYLPAQLDGLAGSEKSILTEGDVHFKRNFIFSNGHCLAIKWSEFLDEPFSEGDILSINESGKIEKIKNNHRPFIGVYSNQPSFCLYQQDNKEEQEFISIIILGITNIRIKGQITAGDWIGYLDAEPGIAQKVSPVQKQHGIAVAMGSSAKASEKLISCMLKR